MDYLITTLKNFVIEEDKIIIFPNETDEHRFQITKNEDVLNKVIDTYDFKKNFGLMHVDIVKNNFAGLVSFANTIKDSNIRNRTIYIHNLAVRYFINSLWFIKDNAVMSYFTTMSSSESIPPQIIKTGNYNSCSDGEIKEVFFTYEELKEAAYWNEVLLKNAIRISGEREYASDKIQNNGLTPFSETTSLGRAFLYLNNTRREAFLPAKIAGYISILEVLCAVSGENTYKVSERVATLLGGTLNEKLSNFDSVKKAYDFRSKYVHGSHINFTDVTKIKEVSMDLDEIVRNVLKQIVKEYPHLNYSNKKREGFLNFEQVDREYIKLILT
ncbi:hypothetical protein [Lysinibacillus fusiformis]|uniref:hypothetical protein n=1 Tax=Lysinibacillus fusiformis TaxID=28031 RepID=UPI0035BF67DC|nr:HEPN domain-containing protein [Lysinibacillus fusiformis]